MIFKQACDSDLTRLGLVTVAAPSAEEKPWLAVLRLLVDECHLNDGWSTPNEIFSDGSVKLIKRTNFSSILCCLALLCLKKNMLTRGNIIEPVEDSEMEMKTEDTGYLEDSEAMESCLENFGDKLTQICLFLKC